jgi:hypothetical protein
MKAEEYTLSLNSYIQSLKAHAAYLQKLSPPLFHQIEIDCTTLNEDLKIWQDKLHRIGIEKESSVLYYISFSDYNPELILSKAAERKAQKNKQKKLALPQINHGREGNILYVGKCNTNFLSRLKYHLGLGGSSTYALNLKHWASQWKFTLHIACVKFNDHEKEIFYLEQMETALHLSLQPLLGRSGH